jgi:N-methylhydantoinase B
LQRDVRVLCDEAALSVLSDRNTIPPYGVRQGLGGSPNRFSVVRDGKEIAPSHLPGKVTGFTMRRDDVLVMCTAGGGGLGDPLDRDPGNVANDVRYAYISADKARDTYGVMLSETGVDETETLSRRQHLRSQRMHLVCGTLEGAEFADNRRVAALSARTAGLLQLAPGTLIEVPSALGPSLRAWIAIDDNLLDDICALGASALTTLGIRPGTRVWIRQVAFPEAVVR